MKNQMNNPPIKLEEEDEDVFEERKRVYLSPIYSSDQPQIFIQNLSKEYKKNGNFVEILFRFGKKIFYWVINKWNIKMKNGKKEFREEENKKALNDVSLLIDANECFGLLGPNGAGKTTLLSFSLLFLFLFYF